MAVAPPVQEMVERFAERGPGVGRLIEGFSTTRVKPVVLAVRPLIRWNYVRVQRPGLKEASQRAVNRCIANMVETVFPEPPNHAVAVAIRVGEHGEDAEGQNTLQQPDGVPFRRAHMR